MSINLGRPALELLMLDHCFMNWYLRSQRALVKLSSRNCVFSTWAKFRPLFDFFQLTTVDWKFWLQMLDELCAALEMAQESPCKTVLLVSAGPVFCSGFDLRYFTFHSSERNKTELLSAVDGIRQVVARPARVEQGKNSADFLDSAQILIGNRIMFCNATYCTDLCCCVVRTYCGSHGDSSL